MKDINILDFVAGIVIVVITGIITILIFGNMIFSGLCIVAISIIYRLVGKQK